MDAPHRSPLGSPARPSTPPPGHTSPVITQQALGLLDVPIWVGSPAAQQAVDDALTLVISRLLGPSPAAPQDPPAWMLGGTGRADLASVRAATARLNRLAESLDHEDGGDHGATVAPAARGLAAALAHFADELREVHLAHRAASPRGDAPSAQPIGALRASKRLVAACRDATASLQPPTSG